jgi:hypothetical protein
MANLTGTRALGGTSGQTIQPASSGIPGFSSIIGAEKPVQPNPDRVKQTLQAAIDAGGPTAQQAKQLLDALNKNPALAQDPNFGHAVDQVDVASAVGGTKGGQFTSLGSKLADTSGATTSKYLTDQQTAAGQTQQDALIAQIMGSATKQQADNTAFSDKYVVPALNRQQNAVGAATELNNQALAKQQTATDTLNNKLSAAEQEQRGLASTYNSAGTQQFNNYKTGQDALNTQDSANLSRYMGETDPLMQQLKAAGSNPQDIAQQQAALAAATGAANGSLDYQAAQSALAQSALAQAQYHGFNSSAADVNRQTDTFDALQGTGAGGLDYKSQAAKAFADQLDVANQRKALGDIQKDVAGGDADQRDAYNTIKGRTGVEATAQEAFLAEQARRKFENDDRSSREAVMQDQAARGLRSGSAEIANQLAERDQNSSDRVLAQLGMQAQAIGRAKDYTGMQADQANAMRGSSQNALGLQSALSTNMRNASFDEDYKRGVGADTASANNQGTRLSGQLGAANQSNQIRQSNDAEGQFNANAYNTNQMFNTGQANTVGMFNAGQANQVGMFNAGQTNQAQANNQSTRMQGINTQANQSNQIRNANDSARQFQEQYAQNEANRVGNLAGQRAQTGLATTAQQGTRNDTTYTAGTNLLGTNYGRDKDTVALGVQNAPVQYGADRDLAGMISNVGQLGVQNAAGLTGSASSVASGRSGTGQSDTDKLIEALKLSVGNNQLKTANGY